MPARLEDIEGEVTLLETATGAWKVIPIDQIVPADWNYKSENPDMEEKLEANLKRLGQVENTHVRQLDTGYYEMINGNHRLATLKELEETHVVAFDHGDVSQAEAIRRAIETNETNFEPDHLELGARIDELAEAFDLSDLETTLPLGDLDDLLGLDDFDFDDFEEDYEADPEDEEWTHLEVSIPAEVEPLWDQTREDVADRLQEDGYELHEDEEVRNGQILEALCAEYMGSDQSPLPPDSG